MPLGAGCLSQAGTPPAQNSHSMLQDPVAPKLGRLGFKPQPPTSCVALDWLINLSVSPLLVSHAGRAQHWAWNEVLAQEMVLVAAAVAAVTY